MDATSSTGPDVLNFGPAPVRRESRRALVVVVSVVAALVVGFGVWRALPEPPTPFSLADLQGVYTGMVRGDGTNEVSTVTRDKLTEQPARISPAACVPLLDTTLSNQFPKTALDGVSTYWLNEGPAAISLLTYRYADAAAARAQFQSITAALQSCTNTDLRVDRRSAVRETEQLLGRPPGVQDYLSYVETQAGTDTRFSTDVALVDNTVSWQYRLDNSTPQNYSPAAAQELMQSLVMQMHAVQDAHR